MLRLSRSIWVLLPLFFPIVLVTKQAEGAQVKIALVSARDHIEGNMLGNQAVYADGERIYLATYQGRLFVLAREVVSAVVWKMKMAYPSGRLATLAARPRQTVGPRRIRHDEA